MCYTYFVQYRLNSRFSTFKIKKKSKTKSRKLRKVRKVKRDVGNVFEEENKVFDIFGENKKNEDTKVHIYFLGKIHCLVHYKIVVKILFS